MISNVAVQRLIEVDRDALIDLMAVAHAHGRMGGGLWDTYLDPDIKELLELAKMRNRIASQPYTELQRWNSEMKGI